MNYEFLFMRTKMYINAGDAFNIVNAVNAVDAVDAFDVLYKLIVYNTLNCHYFE